MFTYLLSVKQDIIVWAPTSLEMLLKHEIMHKEGLAECFTKLNGRMKAETLFLL